MLGGSTYERRQLSASRPTTPSSSFVCGSRGYVAVHTTTTPQDDVAALTTGLVVIGPARIASPIQDDRRTMLCSLLMLMTSSTTGDDDRLWRQRKISRPVAVEHTTHVSYNPTTRAYSGLPNEWKIQLNRQFGRDPTTGSSVDLLAACIRVFCQLFLRHVLL